LKNASEAISIIDETTIPKKIIMSILPLVIAPNPLLYKVSKPVEIIDDELKKFMDDMLYTMYDQAGVGLAGVQVGALKRILVIDVNYKIEDDANNHAHTHDSHCDHKVIKNKNPRYFINPKIIETSKDSSNYNEGCLSFPSFRADVSRPKTIKIKFLDFGKKEKIETMTGLLATCIQHEIDHLNGITFVDHISKLKRDIILKKMKKNY
jgi:peptide deformylase